MTGTSGAGRVWRAILWLGVVIVISVAGSGLVLALDHRQTNASRPELTASGDALVEPRLSVMAQSLGDLADAADTLAKHGRDVLAHLRAQQMDVVRSDLAAGDQVVAQLSTLVATVKAARDGVLSGTSLDAISTANQDRVGQIDAAIASTNGLPTSWSNLAAATPAPVSVLEALAAHDAQVVKATDAARASDWATALLRLGDAATQLGSVSRVSAQLKTNGLDVSVLDDWVLRLSDYDGALVKLYTLLQASNGVMTAAATAALHDVDLAQAALPPDNSGLTVIVSDIGGQRITQALLEIERARRATGVAAGR